MVVVGLGNEVLTVKMHRPLGKSITHQPPPSFLKNEAKSHDWQTKANPPSRRFQLDDYVKRLIPLCRRDAVAGGHRRC